MNEAQVEAVANADAHTSNAGLPTYTDLLAALKMLIDETNAGVWNCPATDNAIAAIARAEGKSK